MKHLKNGKHIHSGYLYKGYEVRNQGYYPPDQQVWWEAINIETGEADYHSETKRGIKAQIDALKALNGLNATTTIICRSSKSVRGEELIKEVKEGAA